MKPGNTTNRKINKSCKSQGLTSALIFCVKEKKNMLAREATKADIQAVRDRLREAKKTTSA